MSHTQIVTSSELENHANTRDSEAIIPELICLLIKESAPDLTLCRIPYGDSINQPGWDGLVETRTGFRQFVPANKSYWEIGTGGDPQEKATQDISLRTRKMSLSDRKSATFVFVTPRGAGSAGWTEPAQSKWIGRRKRLGWGEIKVLDNVQIADWLREFPAIGKWLLKKMGLVKTISGFSTPTEHWENIQQLSQPHSDPPLPPKLFLEGREQACLEIQKVFQGNVKQLVISAENENDVEDFVAAYLASLDTKTSQSLSNKCLFINDADAWLSMANLRSSHVFVAHPKLDLEGAGEQLHMNASKRGHGVVFPISGSWAKGNNQLIPLPSPSASSIEKVLNEGGYRHERAHELAAAGALSLAALKRHLRGLGASPPYATWDTARLLAQAGLIGRWFGDSSADKSAMEILLGKSYGEWIEVIRAEALRPDTPLIQRNENWKVISRGEAWSALGPRLSNEDLDRFQKAALMVLGERDPKLELPPEDRFAASIHGKALKHSASIRSGIAETLALLGCRPHALSSCSLGKAEAVAVLTVRALLKDADWMVWAGLNEHLPMLAEAAPDEFMDSVESALVDLSKSPFKVVFSQERSGVMGRNYTSGLLWSLEILAWNPEHLQRVTSLLGDLAAIDPGGNWGNRPANSLRDIFLPWHPQTCASISKRKSAVEALLKEQPLIGWKLLNSLLPGEHGITTGCQKPTWRQYVRTDWSETVTKREYWDQVLGYADLAIGVAKVDLMHLKELVDQLASLPNPAHSRILDHLISDAVLSLPESSRLPIWEALVDLVRKHKKFPDAQWVMPPDVISRIEDVAARLAPKSVDLLHRRLFSDRDFDLFDETGNFEDQQKNLNLRRQSAIREILNSSQLDGVLRFLRTVASPRTVGVTLGQVDWDGVDNILLPYYLTEQDNVLREFTGNFVWGRFLYKGWSWVEGVIANDWTTEQKVFLFSFLPFHFETWRRAETLLGEHSAAYWILVNVLPYGPQPFLIEAVEKLVQYDRPKAALSCIGRLVHEKVVFPPALAVKALLDSLHSSEPSGVIDRYSLGDVIKWLQNNPDTSQDDLFAIEWTCLPLLDHDYGGTPKTLEHRLSSDPSFFCEALSIAFKSEKDEEKERKFTEAEKNIAQNAFRLLDGWRQIPGITIEGRFDRDSFEKWLTEVICRTKESGHHGIALNQIGQVLVYSPPDPDGLWIHRSIAKALDAKDAADMRSGFTIEYFNKRGVHTFSEGKQELAIANDLHKKADSLEETGFTRFATAIRELARNYERDAERETRHDPFEDR